jgi:heme-degrading monooxygenase HmoA
MYAHITRWEFAPGAADDTLSRFVGHLLPQLQQASGFHSCEAIKTAPDHALAISRWESEAGIATAGELTREWVLRHAGNDVVALHTTADRACTVVASVGR